MPNLQSCFFCGTAENVKEYAVVPPRYTEDGDPQVAVLCSQCKPKLLQVIEPLVGRLEGDGAAGAAEGAQTGDATETATASDPSTTASQQTAQNPGGESVTMSPGGSSGMTNSAGEEPATETRSGEPDTTSEPGAVTPSAEQPPNYRRAMRMLSNREFPLDRTEVESMLAGAYDMENYELEAVLDHAVEAGDLREEDGQFWDGE